MNVTIFGAESYIGRYLMNLFAINNHNVIAFVNKPGQIRLPPANVRIMVGHNNDNSLVKNAISNSDIVINAYKPTIKFFKDKRYYTNRISNKTIIEEMEKLDKKRFITISRLMNVKSIRHKSFFTSVLINKLLYKNYKKEFLNTEKLLKDSNLDWTILKIIHTASSNKKGIFRYNDGNNKKIHRFLSDYNAACFLYKIATEDLFVKDIAIASNK